MPIDEPGWWYRARPGRRARALAPVAHLYGSVAERRFRNRQPYRSRLPVICVGNLTAGGTGKTPLALLIAEYLLSQGETPAFLTRGYGGQTVGPKWVDLLADTARDVGDEALLLAQVAPTLVSRDRKAGAIYIERGNIPATVVVMDDGLQNPALRKDLVIAVVDGARGFGNGQVIPAGPLRARLGFQLGLVHMIVVNGPAKGPDDGAASDPRALLGRGFQGPVLAAEAIARGETDWLKDARCVAFAGIGNPERFFALLRALGATVVAARPFPDHHAFSEHEAGELLSLAEREGLVLVTTEKDAARLNGAPGARGRLRAASRVLPIRTVFADEDGSKIAARIDEAVKFGGYRQGAAQR